MPSRTYPIRDFTPKHQKADAAAASISVETVKRVEKTPGKVSAYTGTMEAIQKALEAAGVEFTNDDAPGVRLRRSR